MLIKMNLYFQILTVLILSGCMSQPARQTVEQPAEQPVIQANSQVVTERQETPAEPSNIVITYLNSNVFDQGVSSNMNVNNRTIYVKFPVRFTLNNIPERIDKWLTEIVNNDGKVELEEKKITDGKYRSFSTLAAIVEFAVSIYNKATEENIYAASQKYNSKIIYEPESGEILEILLYPRK